MTTGYDLRKDIVRGTGTEPAPAPSGSTVKHGKLSGQVILHAASVPGASGYEAEYTQGDPHGEAVWTDAGSFSGCSRIEINGLTPGRFYWFRLRAFDGNGKGAWTDPASLMVI